jgi:hypothetical protein
MKRALLAKSINNLPLTTDKNPPPIIKRPIRRQATLGKVNPLPDGKETTVTGRTHGGKIPRAHFGACVFHTGTISDGGQIKAREIFNLFLSGQIGIITNKN